MRQSEKPTKRQYGWQGQVSGEGGPVLVADLEDYLSWGGAEAKWEESSAYVVHSYGPLVRRLPSRLLPDGRKEWHQNARIETLAAAQSYLRALIEAVLALEPSARLRDQLPMSPGELFAKVRAFHSPENPAAREDWLKSWRDHLEQGMDFTARGKVVFHVDLNPDTDYARGCDALADDAARISFGKASHGVLWELEGAGTCDVALSKDRRGLLLLRTWVDDDQGQMEARQHAENTKAERSLAKLDIRSGNAVVVWSTAQPSDHVKKKDAGPWLRSSAGSGSPIPLTMPGMSGIGVLFQLQRGRYSVACGSHETETWSSRWARFVRRSSL